MSTPLLFSDELTDWLQSSQPKTLGNLQKVFAEKSFALIFLILMFFPALPLPTGGITHVFEIITMLLALELIIGRTTIWLPNRWQKLRLSSRTIKQALPFMSKRIKWFERFSKERLKSVLKDKNFLRLVGLLIFLLALTAFLAPPFTGLDTLPALGVVVIALALILEDMVVLIIGLLIGSAGVALELALGSVIVHFLSSIF
jgi:hypothetical protein